MKLLRKTIIFLSVMVVFASRSSACCTSPTYTCSTLVYEANGETGIIISVVNLLCQNIDDPLAFFTDTLFPSTMISAIHKSADSSDVVVVATVVSANIFLPKPDSAYQILNKAESITVHVDTVLKGTMSKRDWKYIKIRTSELFEVEYDSTTDQTVILNTVQTFALEKSYVSIVGKKFLLFLKNQDIDDTKGLPFPLNTICDPHTYGYLVDENDNIQFDGYSLDTLNGKVLAVPEIQVNISRLTGIGINPNGSGVRYKTATFVPVNKQNTPFQPYNLLGMRIKPKVNIRQIHPSSQLYIYSGSEEGRIFAFKQMKITK